MAPYPEEIDVFTLPHSRMKQLVDVYSEKLVCTDFADYVALESLLRDLHHTFCEFRSHEQIENKFIMKKLRKRLKTLSIHDAAVCNCHSDNRLSDMLALVEDGYSCTFKPEADRINFGVKLQNAIQEFTGVFLPHMKEEEEVFQPMLMKYFEYEELKCLKEKVIQAHSKWHSYDVEIEKNSFEEAASDLKLDTYEPIEESGIQLLPSEILSHIFSFLSPREILRCSVVSRRWYDVSHSPSLWREIYPCFWAHGIWEDYDENHEDRLKKFYPESFSKNKQLYDEDADIDEYEEYEEFISDGGTAENFNKNSSEANALISMINYLLPRVGSGVKKVNLSSCKSLTSRLLRSILILCPNVVHLDVSYTSILDASFKGLKEHSACTNVQYLDLSGCKEITDLGLFRLADSIAGLPPCVPDARRELRDVYLEDCRQQQNACMISNRDNSIGDCCCEIEESGSWLQKVRLCNRCEADKFCSSVCFWQKDGIMCHLAKLSLQCPYVCSNEYSRKFDISSGASSILRTTATFFSDSSSRSQSSSRTSLTGDGNFANNERRTLKYLNLSGCKEITDDGLRYFFEAELLHQLEFLDVSGCFLLTGYALCSIVEEVPSLLPENLFYCDQIENGPYQETANGCQNLENGHRACCCNRFSS